MKKSYFLLSLLLLLSGSLLAQDVTPICVAFYNCENFFDTKDDKNINDEEFLPISKLAWDIKKYETKKEHIAQVITAFNNNQGADIIGLCEIENRGVLEDLLKQDALKKENYTIIHHDSPDLRGIDVALLYKKKSFNFENAAWIGIHFPDNDTTFTRDILVAKGHFNEKNTTYIFVNHLPSRRGGVSESAKLRVFVAQKIHAAVDSIHRADATASFIIMGDMNDEPNDKSMQIITQDTDETGAHLLINTMQQLKNEHLGTIYYRGEWSLFDQIIISSNLMNNSSVHYLQNSATINKFPFLLETEEKYKGQPLRTYVGQKYLGGYSDHLPVNIILEVAK